MRRQAKGWAVAVALLFGALLVPEARAEPSSHPQASPADCGDLDTPEPGIQGDVTRGATRSYNCGLSLVGSLAGSGAVQVVDDCAYVRTSSGIKVVDVANPANPVELTTIPSDGSETMRAVVAPDRSVLVTGGLVYEVSDCRNPELMGNINWLQTSSTLCCPHDIRVSHDATKVFMSFGTQIADISDLGNSDNWTVTDYTCEVSLQYHPVHQAVHEATGTNAVCENVFNTRGQQSHGPDDNRSGTRLYIGGQTSQANGYNPNEIVDDNTLRVLDLTPLEEGGAPVLLDEIPGPGHSVDWYRTADGREWVLHANEIAVGPMSCTPRPRPSSLGWSHEAYITEVTGDTLRRASFVELNISKPENCAAKVQSGQNTDTSYHAVDNPDDARLGMVSMGGAGLRVFDIRNGDSPVEAAYFNVGALVHAGVSHYDAARGLIFAPGGSGLLILELQPQVIEALGMPTPTDPTYPRYPTGRPAAG